MATQAPVTSQEVGETRYLVGTHKAKKPVPGLRIVGNFLILVGLMLLFGIGGWYGYTTWSNQEYLNVVEKEFGPSAIQPSVDIVPPTPYPTIVPPAPIPVLVTQELNLNGEAGKSVEAPKKPVEDNSPPVQLHIPSVGIDSKVVPISWAMIPAGGGKVKSEWQVADFAIGHHSGSVNPGQIGNVVLSGHVDYKGAVFKELHNVKKGDEVVMHTEKGQYLYVVTDLKIVLEEGASQEEKERNARFMNPTPDATLTMITCWPYGIDTHRLIVIAKPYQSSLSAQSEFTIR